MIEVQSLGLLPHQIKGRATLLRESELVPWPVIKDAWKGISEFPLSIQVKRYLQDMTLENYPASLWQINSPKIFVYQFPNKELKYFLIGNDQHLYEYIESTNYYNAFPFIHNLGGKFAFDVNGCETFSIDDDTLWFPHNPNYSHFLCDYYGPCSIFSEDNTIKDAKMIQLHDWASWQLELINKLELESVRITNAFSRSPLICINPKSVLLPLVSSPLHSQWALRKWIEKRFKQDSEINSEHKIIYLKREGERSKRIKNSRQIELVVKKYGGISIDISKYNFSEKISLLSKAKVIIGDGSSSLNAVLFMPTESQFIALVEPLTLSDPKFIDGGWGYNTIIANKLKYVIGTDPSYLQGSPLCSAKYSADEIEGHIKTILGVL